jgi:hypothetical protein
MVINAIFMALEVTVFNYASDINNSILHIFWIASTTSLLLIQKYRIALTIFTLIYALSFNVFNLICFGSAVLMLNGTSAILKAAATVF